MSERVALRGSERILATATNPAGAWDPEDAATVTVHLKPRRDVERKAKGHIQIVSHRQLLQDRGSRREEIDRVVAFAHAHGLDIESIRPEARSVRVTGSVAQLNNAFGVTLERHEHAGGAYRGRRGPITLPKELADLVSAVTGLDDRPVARPLFCAKTSHPRSTDKAFLPTKLRTLYGFPSDAQATGKGQTVAIIELVGPKSGSGGDQRCGYRHRDIAAYFKEQLQFSEVPELRSVSVNGARNSPTGELHSADREVALDIEVVGAVAPGARIVVYFTTNTDDGFLNAIKRAIHDRHHNPCALSISWGGAESTWTEQSMLEYDQAFRDAAALGISVLVAAGDHGAKDSVSDRRFHVDFPASSPHVTACGGTNLEENARGFSETVWQTDGATGGGVSDFFDRPDYQAGIQIVSRNPGRRVGRIVPDVSGAADPLNGYIVSVDAQRTVLGGTSAVAPLYSGLIALLAEQHKTRFGLLNPRLYELGSRSRVYRDITRGSNGGYSARKGFDACTGFGSIHGRRLGEELRSSQKR